MSGVGESVSAQKLLSATVHLVSSCFFKRGGRGLSILLSVLFLVLAGARSAQAQTPEISISPVTVVEGNSGLTPATFTVTLSSASTVEVSVDFSTVSGTALAGSDFFTTNGVLVFSPGDTSKSFSVLILGDATEESNEQFQVVLSNPTNATLGTATVSGTIINDDALPIVSILSTNVIEGDASSVFALFEVVLSKPSLEDVVLEFSTASGTATSGADFSAANGTVTVPAGLTSTIIGVSVSGDTLDEDDEIFFLNLTGALNATLATSQGSCTIYDNDPPPAVSVNDVSILESTSGSVTLGFTVRLSAASGRSVSVDASTSDGTASSGVDYLATSSTVTFSPGTTTRTFQVTVLGDSLDEENETLSINLTAPVNATISDGNGIGTIIDNDPAPSISIADSVVVEGNSGTTNATMFVTLSAPSGRNVSIAYETFGGTATAGVDFSSSSGVVLFPPGSVSQSVNIPIISDLLVELDESFEVRLTNATAATIADSSGLLSIINDDLPSITVSDVQVAEGNGGTTEAIFSLSLSAPVSRTVSVQVLTESITATPGTDYAPVSMLVSFAPGSTSQTVSVAVYGDILNELDETFVLNLSAPSNAFLQNSSATCTITNDDPLPSVSIYSASIAEGNSGSSVCNFTVNLSAPSGRAVSVNYTATAATALAGSDFVPVSGILTFAPGLTTLSVDVIVLGDTLDEINEAFSVTLSNPVNASLGTFAATGTIIDDDSAPAVSIGNLSLVEGNTGATNAVFTVSLSSASGQTVTVGFTTVSGSAVAGTDFTATNGVVTFIPGSTVQTFAVPVLSDGVNEANEQFSVTLNNPVNATIGTGTGTATIVNDDPVPVLSLTGVTVTEPDSGTVTAVFTATLSSASGQTVTANFASASGSAQAGTDFLSASGSINFNPGVTTQTISVNVNGDLLNEPDESFTVSLSSPVNAALGTSTAACTILNDDPVPAVSISGQTLVEGNSTTNALFTVTLSSPSGQSVAVLYSTSPGTAAAGSDYISTNGTVTFAPGQTSQSVAVLVMGDLLDEPNETFTLTVSDPINATLGNSAAVATIVDDDAQPSISIGDAISVEGNSGSPTLSFSVTLSAASGQTISANYATANGTAISGTDYTATSGTLSFAPGVTSQTILVPMAPDLLDEPDETLTVTLSSPVNVSIADGTAIGTITDDDSPPAISISSASLAEGNAGFSSLTFTLTLSAPSGRSVSVDYATTPGTALAGSDFVATSGTVSFPPGTTTQTLSVSIYGDTLNEPNETFTVTLSNPVNATVSSGTATGTITNDDPIPSVSIAGTTITEGNSGTKDATLALGLSAASGQTVSVQYATANGSALAGFDYIATNGVIAFVPGQTATNVVVKISGDLLYEAAESFTVALSNPVSASVGGTPATCTISNDDSAPTVSIADVSLIEGNSGVTNAAFTVTISAVSGLDASATYTTGDSSATQPADYTATNGTVTVPAGSTSASIIVPVKGDTLDEADESFTVALSAFVNSSGSDTFATGTIIDDDALPALSINSVSVAEGPSGVTTNAVLTITLAPVSGRSVTVNYATAGITASSGSDYTLTTGTATFPAGSATQQISIPVLGDNLYESNETFQVLLSSPANATIAAGTGTATIVNDEPIPQLSITDLSLVEGDTGTTSLVFTVSFTQPSALNTTVQYATAAGTAASGTDFTATSGNLSIPPGNLSGTISVPILGDLLNEANETFTLTLSNPTNAVIQKASGTGTIVDNDPVPSLSVADIELLEGVGGTTNAIFTLALSAVSGRSISLGYATADGSATAGSDYTATNGTVTISPGAPSGSIAVRVLGDALFETNETLFVNLSSPANVTLNNTQARATILADESRTIWFTNAAPIEITNSGAASPYPSSIAVSGVPGTISQVLVALDGVGHAYPIDLDVVLVNATTNVLLFSDRGGANPVSGINLLFDDSAAGLVPDSTAIFSGTFRPSADGTLDIFPNPVPNPPHGNRLGLFAGQTPNQTWSLYVIDDLSGNNGAIARGWRLGLVTTNLVAPGAFTNTDLSITVADSPDPAPTEQPMSYHVTVINSGPAPATSVVLNGTLPSGVPFNTAAVSQGTWSRNANALTANIGSLAVGATATLTVTLTPTNPASIQFSASISGAQIDGFPANNSAIANTTVYPGPPFLSVADVIVTERSGQATQALFQVSLNRPWTQTVTANYATANGTATGGTDYYTVSGLLSFPPGTTNLTVPVTVLGDTTMEPNETFFLDISSPTNALIADARGQGTILNDDSVSGSIDRFVWSTIAPVQYQGTAIPVTITAVDPSGAVISGFNGSAALTSLTGSGTIGRRLLITEVDQNIDGAEFANATGIPLDVTGWKILFYDWICWPAPCQTFEFPSGTVIPAAGIFTIRDTGTYPGTYPNFFSPQNISWFNDTTLNPVAVMILNPAGQMEDFFCSVDALPTEIQDPLPVPTTQWSGSPTVANTISSLTYQRVGSSENNNATDFQLLSNTMGAVNSGLTLPWAGPSALGTVFPSVTGPFINGVWSGTISFAQAVTNVYVRADDLDGHVGNSATFEVRPAADLALSATVTPSIISVGQDVSIAFVVTNRGSISAQSVVFSNVLPANLTYKSASVTQGSFSRSGQAVTATLGNIGVAGQAGVTIIATANAPGGATNNAGASTITLDGMTENNSLAPSVWVNFPPTVSPVAGQNMLEDGAPLSVNVTVGDLDNPVGTLVLTATSTNPGLIPSPVAVGGSGSARTLTLTPLPNAFGTTTINLSVSDGRDSSSTSFLLSVTAVNDAPILGVQTNRTINELTLLTVTNVATDIDTPAAGLTYSLENPPAGATINTNGVIFWTPAESQGPGSHVITTIVRDNASPQLSATNAFTVVVNEVNSAPIISVPATRTVIEGNLLSTSATATDSDLPANTLTFQLVSGPGSLAVSTAGAVTWTPPLDFLPSTNTVTVRVFDNGTPSLSSTGSFLAVVNHRPVPASPTVQRYPLTALKIPIASLLGTDPDGDPLSLSSFDPTSPGGVLISSDGVWLAYRPASVFNSADSFNYVVADSRGASRAGTVSVVTVPDPNSTSSTSVENLGGGSFRIRFAGIPGFNYIIQFSASLTPASWQALGTALADDSGAVITTHNPPGGTQGYYRIVPSQ